LKLASHGIAVVISELENMGMHQNLEKIASVPSGNQTWLAGDRLLLGIFPAVNCH